MTWIKTHQNLIYIALLLVITIPLRFINLGYSDYISDEPGTFMYRGNPANYTEDKITFILNQKKGPLQLFIGYLPKLIVGSYNNELAQRLPFSIFNTLAIVMCYLFISKFTKNHVAGFVGALLLSLNGFVAGFGRIAQYQSLNLFFSFAALYFYSDLLSPKADILKKSLFGTFMLSLSLLAHWDAFLIFLPLGAVLLFFIKNTQVTTKIKTLVILANLALATFLLSFFLIPYVHNFSANSDNQAYFDSRVGLQSIFDKRAEENLFLFSLYNPFVTGWVYVALGLTGIFFYKKSYILSIWLFGTLLYYAFLVQHAGTHIYNIFLPLGCLCGIGVTEIYNRIPKWTKIILMSALSVVLVFLSIQTYILFVDHKIEYPWDQEKIVGLKTQKYEHGQPLRHLLGFPLKRYWTEINEYVTSNENLPYVSNENKTISSFYMSTPNDSASNMYLIGIKRPYSFANDYKFREVKGEETVHKIENDYGETVVTIYLLKE